MTIHVQSKIAVIGPQDIVTKCISLQSSFPSLNLQPFIYQSDQETSDIVMQLGDDIQYILFGGPIPSNNVANLEKVKAMPTSYIPFHGSSLLRALFHAQQIGALYKFSYDTVSVDLLVEAFEELALPKRPGHIMEIHPDQDGLFLASYHQALFEQGETIGAVTSSAICYSILQKNCIPCIKITPLISTIREALEKVELTCDSMHNIANQVSVGIISIKKCEKFARMNVEQNKQWPLKLEQFVSRFVKKLDGQYVKKSPTLFLFFTTRAMIEKQTDSFSTFPSFFKKEELPADVLFSLGVGIGGTTNSASKSAFVALKEAEKYLENCLFVVEETQKVIGPITQKTYSQSIDLRTTDAHLLAIAQKASVSTKTLSRVFNAIKQVGDEFTVNEIAPYMGVSIKNMQRICRKLETAGALVVVGKETLEAKGKPRRIFRIKEGKAIPNDVKEMRL